MPSSRLCTSFAALFFSLLLPGAARADIQVECGFSGFVKQQQWFPVRATGCPPGTPIEATVVQKETYPRPRERILFRATGAFPADTNLAASVLCQHPQGLYGEAFLRVEAFEANGSTIRREVGIKPLQQNDTLVLTLSRTPHAFNLLGSIHRPNRGVVCVVACDRNRFPLNRRDLAGIDLILMDDLDAPLSNEQQNTLAQWVAGGGTAVFTAKALLAKRGNEIQPLLVDLSIRNDTPVRRSSPALSRMLNAAGRYVQSVNVYPLLAPARSRIVCDTVGAGRESSAAAEPSCLVAATDIGLGRVVALGFDWEALDLTDRGFEQGVRQEIWSQVLGLERNLKTGELSNEVVTPDEAKTRFLLFYIAIFLVAYVLVLGPLNALLLRARGKVEWSVVTVPLGAVFFSAAAFVIGLTLRTDKVLHHEFSAGLAAMDQCLLKGSVGVLSPDRSPYTVAMTGPTGLASPSDSHPWRPSPRRARDIETYAFTPECTMSNLKIGMWSMRYLVTEDVVPLGGRVLATATCDTNTLTGTIANGLPFDLKDAWILSRWNRTRLGDIAACTSTNFAVNIPPLPDRSRTGRCENCGRNRRCSSPWEHAAGTGAPPVSKEIERQLTSIRNTFGGLFKKPVLVAWRDAPDPLVRLDRPETIRRSRHMLAIPIAIEFDGPVLAVPPGLTAARCDWAVPGLRPSALVEDIRFNPAGKPFRARFDSTSGTPDELDLALLRVNTREPFVNEVHVSPPNAGGGNQYDFLLPCRGGNIESRRITLYWDTGDPDPDEERSDTILAAYDWTATNWVEIARLRDGTGALDLPDPDRFLERESSLVRIASASTGDRGGHPRSRATPFLYIEIAFEGRRTGK